ncbi:MAG TPA: outer membrane beta-barrel protein [Gammaproteobacteria bacterium]|jgi:opacity protein-like surface antigen|nr:outer membrane beta-barrel protein [Gammaproteobacteria bacterium]
MRLRQLFTAITILFSTSGFCAINANPGFYLGVDLEANHYGHPQGAAMGSDWLFGGLVRPVIGYRFNDYVALEGGYNDIINENRSGNSFWGPDKLRIYSYDLSGKAILPLANGFSIFGKGGLAYTHQYVYNVVFTGSAPTADYTANRIQPLLGAGVSYNISKNLAAEMSASYYFKNGPVSAIEMIGIGAIYTFGDL